MADVAACAGISDDAGNATLCKYGASLRAAFAADGAKAILVGEAVSPFNDGDFWAVNLLWRGVSCRSSFAGFRDEAVEEISSGEATGCSKNHTCTEFSINVH